MKPKFRIGDRVLIDGVLKGVALGIDVMTARDKVFYIVGTLTEAFGQRQIPVFTEDHLTLIGCGIPAPVLRWETGETFTESKVFGVEFRIRKVRNGKRYSVCGEFYEGGYTTLEDAKAACQAYWQQLWDKEMLISRDLPVSL